MKNIFKIALLIAFLVACLVVPGFSLGLPFVALALARDRTRINVKGGGLLKTEVIASGGSAVTMLDLGYLDESGLTIERNMTEFRDDKGNVINVISGGEDWKFDIVLQQSSIDEINLVKNSADEFRHFYYQNKLANGRFQEIYIPLAKIINALELKFKAPDKRLIKVTIQALMPKGAVTVTPAAFNVPADAYGVIIESATAQGEITTATGTIYTAAV